MTPAPKLSPLLLGALLAAAPGAQCAPDAVVAQDGSGQFTSVQEAISAAPLPAPGKAGPWVILVRPGAYRERIYVQRERGDVLLRGEDPARTSIMFGLHAKMPGPDGKPIGTFRTATFQVDGDGFSAEGLTIANDAGPVGQAVALRVDGDRVSFRNCRIIGWQDTLLVNRGRHYFSHCYIEGHVDFIFGAATAFFGQCELHCLRDGYITAASTPQGAPFGLVFADCRITAAEGVRTYLGRPWRDYARVVFLRTSMASAVAPAGWHDWNKPQAHGTAFYAEFASTGPGAGPAGRVPWSRQLSAAEAAAYGARHVLGGGDQWDPQGGPGAGGNPKAAGL